MPATRTIREIPTELVLDTDDGMPESCALSLDNLTSIPKELFRLRITRLSVERIGDVCRALTLTSGCSLLPELGLRGERFSACPDWRGRRSRGTIDRCVGESSLSLRRGWELQSA